MRAIDYLLLTNPTITLVVLLTGFTGAWMGSGGSPRPSSVLWCLAGIGMASSGASVLNNYLDEDIDWIMTRTCNRPLPAGRIPRRRALALGLFLSAASVLILFFLVNAPSALLAVLAIFCYSCLYTFMLKRRTPFSTEIGGLSGALPPVIGWVSVNDEIGLTASILFAIVFLWQPPHFWALASMYKAEYRRARIPAFPVARSDRETKRRALIYVAALVAVTALPYHTGAAGRLYLCSVLALGIIYLSLYLVSLVSNRIPDRWLFRYSIIYLTLTFVSIAADTNPV